MTNYYVLKVIDGIYFSQFQRGGDSLVYTVNIEEAWFTPDLKAVQIMQQSLKRRYQVPTEIVIFS